MPRPTQLGRVRAKIATPNLREVEPVVRGFYPWAEGASIVEPVGTSFLAGFRIAMEQPGAVATMRGLQDLPREWQGFAAEGAGMATAIRDQAMPGRKNFHKLLSVSGGRHTYMMHVGLGWALARLPRQLWPNLEEYDPAVAPLILDGYGFHEVFFRTECTIRDRTVKFPLEKWPGDPGDAQHQLHQGVGRGMWFVAGGSPLLVSELFDTFPTQYASSLWAGVGLAATYAGGRDTDALAELLHRAGPHAPWVRQGSAFAVEARHRANTINSHTPIAAAALCDSTVERLIDLTAAQRPPAQAADSGDWSIYETWRTNVAAELDTDVMALDGVADSWTGIDVHETDDMAVMTAANGPRPAGKDEP